MKINPNLTFILLLGFVSLFSDMVYEGARSIAGPFLSTLGATGAMVGFVFGLGEFIGFTFRVVSGYLVDRSSKYWQFTFIGYLCNIIAIPLLAFAVNWQMAVLFILIERVGKAIRNPSRDAMLSYASQRLGRGHGFGLHQMLDQLGGVLGPLLMTLVLLNQGHFRFAFAVLAIPGLLTLLSLIVAKTFYPHPQHLEESISFEKKQLPRPFWICLAGSSLVAAGYADYPLIAYHFTKTHTLSMIWIPIFYMLAMGASSFSALLSGWFYDKTGPNILIATILISFTFPLFVFKGGFYLALLGMILWGVGIGAQRSLLKAMIGDMVSKKIRGLAYGVFNMIYGLSWFLGSWLIGVLYDVSIPTLILFSMLAQLCSIPFFYHLNIPTLKKQTMGVFRKPD